MAILLPPFTHPFPAGSLECREATQRYMYLMICYNIFTLSFFLVIVLTENYFPSSKRKRRHKKWGQITFIVWSVTRCRHPMIYPDILGTLWKKSKTNPIRVRLLFILKRTDGVRITIIFLKVNPILLLSFF